MRNHHQNKENNNNNTTTSNSNNNNNNNNSNINCTNRYQFCVHPVMSATVTAQHSGATPTITNNLNSSTTAIATTIAAATTNSNTTTSNLNNNNNNSALSPSVVHNTNDTLNLQKQQQQQKQIIKISTSLFNATKTNLSTSLSATTTSLSSSSSSSSPSSGSTAAASSSTSSVSVSLTPPALLRAPLVSAISSSSSNTGAAMPQNVAQQLTKLNNNNKLNNNAADHDQINNKNHNASDSGSCLSDSRKPLNSTTKSFKENHPNNNINANNNNNNNNNNHINCNNNHFTEIMQRTNSKRLSPTQESSNMSFSSASVAGSIQDDIGDQCGLTKAGLEEYTMRSNSFYDNPVLYHHQKQSSYAQSEGYHSYVSSSDSTSATPMLDRLRQESELLSRQTSSHHWSQNDLSSLASNSVATSPTSLLSSGRDLSELASCTQQHQKQQHNNSSESTSSTETLKWLGSMSDVSEVSHTTGFSAISESVSTSQLIVHSSRVLTPKRHQSESVLCTTEEQTQQQLCRITSTHSPQHSSGSLQTQPSPPSHSSTLTPTHRHSPSYPPTHQTSHNLYRHPHNQQNTSPELSKSMTEKINSKTTLSNCDASPQKSNISVTISNSEAVVTISPHPPPVPAPKPNLNSNGCKDSTLKSSSNLAESQSQTNISSRSHGFSRQGSSLGMAGHRSVSASMDSLADIKHPYRNNHRLFPVSTYTEPVHSNTSHFVHHPKPQYSTGLQKPPKTSQTTISPTTGSSLSSSASNSSVTGSHSNLHQPKLGSPNYPQPSWQSVAALINDFERSNDQQQPQKYSYLDPNKTHRVPNPALKAFQKNAIQSYFERQQQQQHQQQQPNKQNHAHSLDNLSPKSYQQQQAILRPTSLQSPVKEGVQTVLLRNSLPSNYNATSGQRPLSEDKNAYSSCNLNSMSSKPPSPAPPPPPPRSRSMMPTLLRRSSSASDYAELRDHFITTPKEKLQSQSIKNISSSEKFSFNDCGMPPPPPPPRGTSSMAPRRTSSAAEYAAIRDKVLLQQAAALTHQQLHPHQHQNVPPVAPHQHLGIMSHSYHHHGSHQAQYPYPSHSPQAYQTGLPLMPATVQDGWVPERPPKNPNLRVPSPELPPPPPGLETETVIPDEPLPPPPPEILQRQPLVDSTIDMMVKPPSPNRRNSFAGASLRKLNLFNRSPSNDSVNVPAKAPPPLIPRKPVGIELLHVSRPLTGSLNQLNSSKLQPELTRATIISSSTRKRPHNLAAISLSSIPAIQENISRLTNHNVRHSPTAPSSPLQAQSTKSSPPPPPLMPRMSNVQPTNCSNSSSNINCNNANQKSRCNSKASYLPRQSLEKQNNSDPDHGSYKMTLHSNEDLVTTTKSSYDILAQTPKLPNNLPDVLPLGAKLQPMSNNSLNSTPSLRYGSNNNISTNAPTSQQGYNAYSQQQAQQQRYSTPTLSTFNMSTNYCRSQSFDTNNVHTTMTQSPTKYMSQSSLDLKRPLNNLETTIEEPTVIDNSLLKETNNDSSLSSLSSLSESCNSHEERLNNNGNVGSNTNAEAANNNNNNSIFRAELVNTTFTSNSNNKKSVTRQESLRENIEKITQLQSQLMSAHITDTNTFMSGFGAQMSPQSVINKTAQAHVIDIPKSQETEKIDEEKSYSEAADECLPPASATTPPPPAVDKDSSIKSTAINTSACNLKSPKILKENEQKPLQNDDSSRTLLSQLDTSTDSLKLVQRSEIILRVNAKTVETASQTDDITDSELKSLSSEVITSTKETTDTTPTRTTLQPRQRLPIEDDCEKMSKELASLLLPSDDLVTILCPPGTKTVADYVSNLYNPNVHLRPSTRDVGTSTLTRSNRNKEDQDLNEKITVELKLSEMEQTPEQCDILKNKVDDLIKHLNKKARLLNKEQSCIEEEAAINDELGNSLLNKLSDKVRPIEASKCRTYIADIGHITGLLLSLSERLARTENSLTITDENNSEKKSLENKRDRLLEQLTEAKRLKEDIDRRGTSVVSLLEKNLSSDEFADFEYFINMKAKLITDARDITDKIKMGEEIISALSNTLIQSDC